MNELPSLIRRGLQTAGIKESRASWAIVHNQKETTANVIGFALIGKVGLEKACLLLEAAFAEMPSIDAETRAIASELGIPIDLCENLVVTHYLFTAEQIAEQLEKGDDPSTRLGAL